MKTAPISQNSVTIFILCGLTAACLVAQNGDDQSPAQLKQALASAQKAINVYQRSAPEQEYQILLEFLRYYRSWYQAVTPAPISLIERLSPAALKFIAQLKFIAKTFEQKAQAMPGATRLSETGDQFYQAVIAMVENQLINKQLAQIMVIPHLQTRLF
jgi:hypothetical protein